MRHSTNNSAVLETENNTPKGGKPEGHQVGSFPTPEPLVDYDTLKPFVGNVTTHTLRRWKVPCVKGTSRFMLYRISEVISYIESGGPQRAIEELKGKAS